MMIETEQGIPLPHAATLHTKIKDLSSYDQHKRCEVLRSSTIILVPLILVIRDTSIYKRMDCLSSTQTRDLLCNDPFAHVPNMKPYQNLNSK